VVVEDGKKAYGLSGVGHRVDVRESEIDAGRDKNKGKAGYTPRELPSGIEFDGGGKAM